MSGTKTNSVGMLSKIALVIRNPQLLRDYVIGKSHQLHETLYAISDSNALAGTDAKRPFLFIDAGSNQGQGIRWFSQHFAPDTFEYALFEPNPNCFTALQKITEQLGGRATLYPVGVGTRNEKVPFYGLDETEGGALSEGGSVNANHNAEWYSTNAEKAVTVEIIDFAAYLQEQAARYEKIIVKMDIEGAENDVLEHLLRTGTHKLIDILYIEFHAVFLPPDMRGAERTREKIITRKLRADGVKVRVWH